MTNSKTKYLAWLKNDSSLKNLSENQIKVNFSSNLSFGTAGLRGLMGAGTNRLNIYTIRHATQALCNYLKKKKIKTTQK